MTQAAPRGHSGWGTGFAQLGAPVPAEAKAEDVLAWLVGKLDRHVPLGERRELVHAVRQQLQFYPEWVDEPEEWIAAVAPTFLEPLDTAGLVVLLAKLLEDPSLLDLPEEVVPRLGWAGRVTLLAAREKVGKSTLATAAAAAKSRGGSFLGKQLAAGSVLWFGLEEHVGDVARRLDEFGADPERAWVLEEPPKGDPLDALKPAAEEARPHFIVIDTLSALVERRALEPGNASQWTPVLSQITRLARDTDAAVLLIHHARKDGGYRDSTAIGAGADVIAEMTGPKDDAPDDGVRRIRVRGRGYGEGDFGVMAVNGLPRRLDLAQDEQPLEVRILAFLRGNRGSGSNDVAKGVKGQKAAILKALKQLETDGEIYNVGDEKKASWEIVESARGTAPEPAGNR